MDPVVAAPGSESVRDAAVQPKGRVLVTGGTGLLGRPLIAELHRRGFAVTSISSSPKDRLHPDVQTLFANAKVEHRQLDLSEDVENQSQSLKSVLAERKFDLVINLAVDRGGVRWDGTKRRMTSVTLNTKLPEALAQITASEELATPLIQLSTEYVWTGNGTPRDGYPPVEVGGHDAYTDLFVRGSGAGYACEKFEAERRLRDYQHVIIVRTPVLYGHVLGALEDGTAGASIQNYLQTNDWSHDTWQKRYPTNAEDCAFVIAALASKHLSVGLERRVYNYGAQTSVSKYRFMELFALATGLPVSDIKMADTSTREEGKRPPFDVKLSIVETRRELGMVGDWREPGELSPLDYFEIWLPYFKGDVASKRGPHYSLAEDTKACLLNALAQRLGDGPRIILLGGHGSGDQETTEFVKTFAYLLSARFADGVTFITDGRGDLQAIFAQQYAQYNRSRLYNLLPCGESSSFDAGKEIRVGLDVQEQRQLIQQLGDVYLAIDPAATEEAEAQLPLPRNASVVPLLPHASRVRGAVATAEAELVQMVARKISAQRIIASFALADDEGKGLFQREFMVQVLRSILPTTTEEDLELLFNRFGCGSDALSYKDFVRWVFADDT